MPYLQCIPIKSILRLFLSNILFFQFVLCWHKNKNRFSSFNQFWQSVLFHWFYCIIYSRKSFQCFLDLKVKKLLFVETFNFTMMDKLQSVFNETKKPWFLKCQCSVTFLCGLRKILHFFMKQSDLNLKVNVGYFNFIMLICTYIQVL